MRMMQTFSDTHTQTLLDVLKYVKERKRKKRRASIQKRTYKVREIFYSNVKHTTAYSISVVAVVKLNVKHTQQTFNRPDEMPNTHTKTYIYTKTRWIEKSIECNNFISPLYFYSIRYLAFLLCIPLLNAVDSRCYAKRRKRSDEKKKEILLIYW